MRDTDPSINNRSLNRSTPQAAPQRTTRKNSLRRGLASTAAALPKLQQFQPLQPSFSAFGSITQFRDAQSMASVIAHSSIVPENYRGDEHLGDCIIALEIANRIGAPILAVMQNLRFVEGKPAWSSQFLISCVNATKRFSPIRFKMTGTRAKTVGGVSLGPLIKQASFWNPLRSRSKWPKRKAGITGPAASGQQSPN